MKVAGVTGGHTSAEVSRGVGDRLFDWRDVLANGNYFPPIFRVPAIQHHFIAKMAVKNSQVKSLSYQGSGAELSVTGTGFLLSVRFTRVALPGDNWYPQTSYAQGQPERVIIWRTRNNINASNDHRLCCGKSSGEQGLEASARSVALKHNGSSNMKKNCVAA